MALISIEEDLVNKLGEDYWKGIVCGADQCNVYTVMKDGNGQHQIKAGTLYKIEFDGEHCKLLFIYVTCSDWIVLGYGAKYAVRLSQASKLTTTSSVLEAAGLIEKGSAETLIQQFRCFFINAEGPFGNIMAEKEERKASFFYWAARCVLPTGYYIKPIRVGVQALAHEIAPGLLKHHAIALMVNMGYDNFRRFIVLHCEFDLGTTEQLATKLEELKSQRKAQRDHENQRRRRDELRSLRQNLHCILRMLEEERSEEDIEMLEEYTETLNARMSQETRSKYEDATLLCLTLKEDDSPEDYEKVAEEVRNIVNKSGKKNPRAIRVFYELLSAEYKDIAEALYNIEFGNHMKNLHKGEQVANSFADEGMFKWIDKGFISMADEDEEDGG